MVHTSSESLFASSGKAQGHWSLISEKTESAWVLIDLRLGTDLLDRSESALGWLVSEMRSRLDTHGRTQTLFSNLKVRENNSYFLKTIISFILWVMNDKTKEGLKKLSEKKLKENNIWKKDLRL
jgi:hypothetical protein